MNKNTLQSANEYIKRRRQLNHFQKAVTCLAAVVVFITTYALILPAITLEEDTYCGYEEHQHSAENRCYEQQIICPLSEIEKHIHTDACYSQESILVCGLSEQLGHTHSDECCEEAILVCGQEEIAGHTHDESCYEVELALICNSSETGHTHSEACYEQVLLCEIPDHSHTLLCHSDTTADVETAAYWEKTIEELELSGNWAEDVLAVAQSQLGYTESTKNYTVMESDDGTEEKKGYSRYGAWYGDAYGDWCAMFVSFCLHYANTEEFPIEASCPKWVAQFKADGVWVEKNDYIPGCGDIIFFDCDLNEEASHVGIVESYDSEKQMICTIEGNTNNMVARREYELNDQSIFGYCSMAAAVDKYASAMILEYVGEDYIVAAHVPGEAFLPDNAQLCVRELTGEEYEDSCQMAMDAMEVDEILFARFFDITFLVNGEKVEPEAYVEVEITYSCPVDLGEECVSGAVHFADSGTEVLDMEVRQEADGTTSFAFVQNSFSVTGTVTAAVENADDGIATFATTGNKAPKKDGEMDVYGNTFHLLPGGIISTDLQLKTTLVNAEFHFNDKVQLWAKDTSLYPGVIKDSRVNDGVVFVMVKNNTYSNKSKAKWNTGELGYIQFKNAGEVNGRSVDVFVTVTDVVFNQWAGTSSNGHAKNTSGQWLLISGLNAKKTEFKCNVARSYQGTLSWFGKTEIHVKTDIKYSDDGLDVGAIQFLLGASDLDGNYTKRSTSASYGTYTVEGYKIVSGFTGDFYGYSQADWLYDVDGLGQMYFYSPPRADGASLSGDDSYYKGGVYALTAGSTFSSIYTEGDCGTTYELYQQATPEVRKRVDDSHCYKKGDKVVYTISMNMGTWNTDIFTPYASLRLYDHLPDGLTFKKAAISDNTAGRYSYDETENVCVYEFDSDWLADKSHYNGAAYTLTIIAEVEIEEGQIGNTAYLDVGTVTKESNEVTIDVVSVADLPLLKVGGMTDAPLSGAKFCLYYWKDGQKLYYQYDFDSGFTRWVSAEDATAVITDNHGTAAFYRLPKGTEYHLVETEAPGGYNLLTSEIRFTLDETKGEPQEISGTDGNPIYSGSYLKIANDSTYRLPDTGGSGTILFYVAGCALMVLPLAIYGCRMRCRREKRIE